MRVIIPVVLVFVLLSGCATTGNRPHPYDRDGNQVKCKTCGQWYDGVPVKSELEASAEDTEQKKVCPECGRVMPETKKGDLSRLGEAIFIAEVIVYGGIALLFAGILGLAFA